MWISDSVDTITFKQVVDHCFEAGTLCENLTRNAEGSLSLVNSGEMNNGGGWRASLAVNNAFDKNRPGIHGYFDRIGTQGGGLNGFDEWGRRYQLSLNMNF